MRKQEGKDILTFLLSIALKPKISLDTVVKLTLQLEFGYHVLKVLKLESQD